MNQWITTLSGAIPNLYAENRETEEAVSGGSGRSEDRSEETLHQSVIHASDRPGDMYMYDDEPYAQALHTCETWLEERNVPRMFSTPADDDAESSIVMPVTQALAEQSQMPLDAMGQIANSVSQRQQNLHERL